MDSVIIERVITGGVAIAASFLAFRANTRASAVQQEAGQLSWVREARQEARDAKVDSEKAEEKADSANRRAAAAERRLTDVEDQIGEAFAWIARVVSWAQDPNISHDELIRLINGGPPTWRRNHTAKPNGTEAA